MRNILTAGVTTRTLSAIGRSATAPAPAARSGMFRAFIIAAAAIALSACSNQSSPYGTKSCGLIGCVSSAHLKAKLSPAMIGKPVSAAISAAGAPTSSYSTGGIDYLTWRREQQDPSLGLLACTESITVKDGKVTDYHFEGHC